MRHGRLAKVALWVVVITVTSAGALIAPRKAVCDASGCSFINYGVPTWYSKSCLSGGSQGCYYCEHSYPGGYSRCWESASGDAQICIDYQY